MTNRSSVVRCVAMAAALLTVTPSFRADAVAVTDPVERFDQSVRQYVALRRAVERRLSPLTVSPDARVIYDAVEARAAAIRQARAGARMGDLFAPEIAELFRARIQRTFRDRGYSAAAVFVLLYPEENDWVAPAVNGAFSWRTAVPTPPCILHVLPALPEELQYRFVGSHLVLVDIDANVIVDVLPDAITFALRSHI
jgi:hypothetical protein